MSKMSEHITSIYLIFILFFFYQATQPGKKVSTGTKREASLMDKARKDHSAKTQKMAEAKPKATSTPAKKQVVKWIKW